MTAAAPQKKSEMTCLYLQKKSGNDRPQPCSNKTEKGENQ